jgi:hypothetical protein
LVTSIGSKANASTGNVIGSNYVAAASATTSYSYLLSTGAGLPTTTLPTFGANVNFTTEVLAGSSQNLYQFTSDPTFTTLTATLIGTFSMNATTGVITFTRANAVVVVPLVPSRIVNFVRAGNLNTISFTTTNGNNYQLLYKTNLTQATWTTNGAAGVVVGNNATNVFSDTTADAQRHYRVQSF